MHWLWAADQALFLAFYGHPPDALGRALARSLLWLSTGGACWLCIFGAVFLIGGRRGRRIALTGGLAILVAHAAAVWGLQGLLQRTPPPGVLAGVQLLARAGGPFSFPAGRVAQAFAAAPFVTRGSGAGPTVCWLLAVGIAWASVYAGLSFPTDIAGGIAVGLCAAGVARWALGDPFRRRVGHLVPLPRRMRARSGVPQR